MTLDEIHEAEMDMFMTGVENALIDGRDYAEDCKKEQAEAKALERKLAYIKLGLKKGIINKEGMLVCENSLYGPNFTHNLNGINLAFYGDDDRVIEAADILQKYKDKIWGLYQEKGNLSIYANEKFEIANSENISGHMIKLYSWDEWTIHWYLPKQFTTWAYSSY